MVNVILYNVIKIINYRKKRKLEKDKHLLNKAGNVLFALKNENIDLMNDFKKK